MLQNCGTDRTELYDPLHVYSVEDLQNDLDVLVTTIKEAHAHPFLYTSEDKFDKEVDNIRSKLRPMTEREFLNIAAPLVTSLRCGHTYVYPSKEYIEYRNQNGKFFPIPIRIVDNRFYANCDDRNSVLPRGSEILKINGQTPEALLHKLLPCLSSDGFVWTGKIRRIENHFGLYYNRYISQADTFRIQFVTLDRRKRTITFPSISYSQYKHSGREYTEPVRFWIDESSEAAILRLNTLYTVAWKKEDINPKRFLKNVFRTVQEQNITNLIIDIRGNEGGSVYLAADLLAYFGEEELTWCREYRLSHSTSFTYRNAMKHDLFTTFKWLVTRKVGDHRIFNWYGLLRKKNIQSNFHFSGRVFILIDGRTFSAASMFASMAQKYGHAIMIGEETGGTACGNGVSPITVVLPNTQIRMDLAFGYLALNRPEDTTQAGRGVIPHYSQFQFTPDDFYKKEDSALSFALRLAAEETEGKKENEKK